MKKILGLDLGTNSIGWALVDKEANKILGMGSRIIPMDQGVLDTFSGGRPLETQTAARTTFRGTRRLRERHLLRRERLHRVLNVMNFLPEHYANQIDFEKRLGQFFDNTEPKIAYDNRNFIFKKSFDEMLMEFKQFNPQLFYTKPNGKETKIPYDWTIYYLRKKALNHKIEKEELAWIILNFNQKRGYYQLRGEDEEAATKTSLTRVYFDKQIINDIFDTGEVYKGLKILKIELANGDVGKYFSKEIPNWKGLEKNIIVTIETDKDGNDRLEEDGSLKRRFSIPTEEDWEKKWKLIKIKTEKDIDKHIEEYKVKKGEEGTVGSYIYESLLQNPKLKIRGKLVRTIERKYYKKELVAILKKQIELQPELFTDDLYNDCIRELYRHNEAQQFILSKKDFIHLFVEDIIFYQRPLRSQKSTIGNCSLEYRIYKDKDGQKVKEYLKVIPKSHPFYQEFRVWQWLFNLKIYRKEDDVDVTTDFLKDMDDIVNLFDFLMLHKEVGHKDILKYLLVPILKEKYPNVKATLFNKELDKEIAKYRWNYVFDDLKEKEEEKSKKYPCNTTGYEIRRRLGKVENISMDFLTPEIEQRLWHIIYSVTDINEFKSALAKFAEKHSIDKESFVASFEKFPPFKSEYGAYSEKAIKKFLPLMRIGKYWQWDKIDITTQKRIEKIISGEYDEKIKVRVREKAINLTENYHFQGLPLWLASYIIYGRHSEAEVLDKWASITVLEKYIDEFKQYSLRNPIVEQIVTESLRVIRDIWRFYGQGSDNYFDEIHVELGREMKNTREDRERITRQVTENEAANLRIKALLMELKENSDGKLIVRDVRPYSPIQQDILRIYEDGVMKSNIELPDDILKISRSANPTKTELQRYKLWLEQKYRSPYTGQVIPLGSLFTDEYQIEHIIPKSRYFDDSFNNKVICESPVNQLKDKQLGMEFIRNHYGEEVELGFGKKVRIFTVDEYMSFVKEHYAKNTVKRSNLLLEDIPETMIERQMNDTRFISKFICALLSNIVREEKDDDGINSKNLIPVNGKITSILRKDWGLEAVWNDLILPRFERMNKLTNTNSFTYWNEQWQKFLPVDYSPTDSKKIEKKRIDHRHHALDALVIACTTRDHVNLLNNQSAKSENSRYDLQNKLRNKEKETWFDKKTNKQLERDVFKKFKKPWDNFTVDAKNELEKIVVSFKQNLRVINKATNYYQKWIEKDGVMKKEFVKQKGVNWAVRKSLHTPMPYGKNKYSFDILKIADSVGKKELIIDDYIRRKIEAVLMECNCKITEAQKRLKKNPVTDNNGNPIFSTAFKICTEKFRRRQPISVLSNRGQGGIKTVEDAKKYIDKIADFKMREDLLKHLKEFNNNLDLAFSVEGIEIFNSKRKIPIYNLPIAESGSGRFAVGYKISKKHKWVEADKGTNLFYAIYQDEDGARSYETIPLNIVIERLKQGLPPVELKGKNDFYLTPNDLVYVPTVEELENIHNINPKTFDKEQKKNIYKVVSFSGNRLYCIPYNVASSIINKLEFTQLNKIEFTKEKESLVKLKVDRLGNITL